MSEWISIKDKFPDINARIVVSNNLSGALYLATYTTTGGSHNPHEIFESFRGEKLLDVTHWISLPEFPKDKS